jgi:DNA-binding NarL/FixJ family response regulator
MKPLRLLLVDDHALLRDGLRALFSYQDDFEIVGEAEDAASALSQALTLQPDLVLMDIDLPGDDGVVATRRITEQLPETIVVMLTVHDDTERLLDAIKAGAQGYLLKNIRTEELIDQLRGIARGDAALSRRMATRILEEFRRTNERVPPESVLTPRELEVLELVGARLSNKEIAHRLVVSEHTVKNHLKSILAKLQLSSRREAAAYGLAQGWVSGSRPAQEANDSPP